jgi:hypothetical protein
MYNKKFILFLSLILFLLCSGCGVHENTQEEDQQELEALADKINDIVGDASCNDVGDCRTIAFGSKPCGGPWSYLVYSIIDTDTLLLSARVELYNSEEAAYNRKWGIASDCMVVPPPRLICEDGHCTADIPYIR